MSTLLEVRDLHARYGGSHILQGVDLDVHDHECVAVFGRNGVGKTTLMHSIMGLVRATTGSVRLDGRELRGARPHVIARAGVALVPQGRRIFPNLSVEENLGFAVRPGEWNVSKVYELLPRLEERRRNAGTQLSGGEQQMLALGRALVSNPRLLLLDEPSEGLAPLIVQEVAGLVRKLHASGMSALLVEQNVGLGLQTAERIVIMDHGRVVQQLSNEEFRHHPEVAQRFLGVSVD